VEFRCIEVKLVRVRNPQVRSDAWEKLSNGGGWPNVGWREAYVFSLMVCGARELEAWEGQRGGPEELGTLQRAMRHLDMALIMGGG